MEGVSLWSILVKLAMLQSRLLPPDSLAPDENMKSDSGTVVAWPA